MSKNSNLNDNPVKSKLWTLDYGKTLRKWRKRSNRKIKEKFEKIPPFSLNIRRKVSVLLHSIRRMLEGKVETKLEHELLKRWNSTDEIFRDNFRKRLLFIFCNLPVKLQLKIVTKQFIFSDLTSSLEDYFPTERPGAICGCRIVTCPSSPILVSKVPIKFPSEGISLVPEKPIASIAMGESGYLLIDISNPSTPNIFPNSPTSTSTGFVNDIVAFTKTGQLYLLLSSSRTEYN